MAPARAGVSRRAWRLGAFGPAPGGAAVLLMALLGAGALGGAGANDDILSYKSLVLGSLSSGERVSGRVSGGAARPARFLHLFVLRAAASREPARGRLTRVPPPRPPGVALVVPQLLHERDRLWVQPRRGPGHAHDVVAAFSARQGVAHPAALARGRAQLCKLLPV